MNDNEKVTALVGLLRRVIRILWLGLVDEARAVLEFISKKRRQIFGYALFMLVLIICVGFGRAVWSASHDPQDLTCTSGPGIVNNDFTYIEIGVGNQNPSEPYFEGSIFVNLASSFGKNPVQLTITESGGRFYNASTIHANLHYDEPAAQLWMSKMEDMNLVRVSGSHRYFPFDSANFDFDLSYTPIVPIHNVRVRNRNPSFNITCGSVKVVEKAPGTFHISFDAKRNPLVQLTAVVLMSAGLLFLIAIVIFVKSESLPLSIASFFFSLWSIRTILGSEMKAFPTLLDLAILSLCVLFLVLLGFRLAVNEIRVGLRERV